MNSQEVTDKIIDVVFDKLDGYDYEFKENDARTDIEILLDSWLKDMQNDRDYRKDYDYPDY